MEIEAANTFIEIINGKHTDIKLSDFGLLADELLPYVSASPDKILLCSCCEKACVEIKRSYSINYTKPCYSNLEHLRICDGKAVLKKSHNVTRSARCRLLLLELIKIVLLFALPME